MYNSDSLPTGVSDSRSNKNEQILHAVEVVGRSQHRLAVFEAVYYHKKRVKTVSEIMAMAGLSRQRVLQEGRKLVQQHIIGQMKGDGGVAYVQDPFYQGHKSQILRLIKNPEKRKAFPTKRTPEMHVTLKVAPGNSKAAGPRFITIDHIDSFDGVQGLPPVGESTPLSEKQFKEGLQRILREEGEFVDWGGETNDLFTTRLLLQGKRRLAAFALKGPGKKGILKPASMGKNGDQIQRLFRSPADVFLVQYYGQIDPDIIEQMKAFAFQRAAQGTGEVYFGVIDGRDTRRLIAAYPGEFSVDGD